MEIKDIQIPEGINKIPVRLYGIAGWFFDWGSKTPFSFGGYFKQGDNDGLIDGQLIDSYGASQIGGRMTDDSLKFGKKYTDRDNIIHYKFKKQGDFWIGEYDGIFSDSGEAKCLTTLLEEDAFVIACGLPRTDEGIIRDHNFWMDYSEHF